MLHGLKVRARRLRNLAAHLRQVADDERLRSVAMTYGRLDYPRADIHLQVRSRDEFHRLRSCQKEPWTIDWIEAHLQPGEVLYDVGANVGAYTLVAAAAVPDLRVVAFEPGPANYAALCANLALNEVGERATAVPLALGARAGSAVLDPAAWVPGASPRWAEDPTGAGAGVRVLVDRLDDVVARFSLPPANHLKLDVDGREADVLAGGDRLLRSGEVRSAMVELDPECEAAVRDRLSAVGFELVDRSDGGDRPRSAPAYGLFVRA